MKRLHSDLVTGVLLTAVGIFIASYAASHYAIGSLRDMGPGYFPFVLAALLAVSGFVITVSALLNSGSLQQVARTFEPRSFLSTIVAVTSFAALVYPLGLLLATILLAMISLVAVKGMTFGRMALVAIGLALFSWLVFKVGLKMPIPIFPSW